ncbi:frataxin, mitochondrial-like [Daphnia carinata]|uniref:frataxin, mitochondrial-like n=1 Tax=Daphnia carinata TaxID=120202 RepID=UPI00257EE859|nr:frataxin, mitochondrial-like [Daphnia carinata]
MFPIRLWQTSAQRLLPKISCYFTFNHGYSSSKILVQSNFGKSTYQTVWSPSPSKIGWMLFSEGHAANNNHIPEEISLQHYEKICEETLENLCETLDQLLEEKYPNKFDVSLANGVLTVQLEQHGTYVINKQTPNRQIWLSSPTSGPKRYDCLNGHWIYSHDKTTLDDLLNREFSDILKQSVKIVSLF